MVMDNNEIFEAVYEMAMASALKELKKRPEFADLTFQEISQSIKPIFKYAYEIGQQVGVQQGLAQQTAISMN